MLILYFLLSISVARAHNDYGVSFRSRNFDETLKNIDKDAIINHQRSRRFVTGYFVSQNVTNKPTWGNVNITRNNTTYNGPSNYSRDFVANVTRNMNNATRPSSSSVFYPGQQGYITPTYNASVSRPALPNYNSNSIIARPANSSNFNNYNSSGYYVPPVYPNTPWTRLPNPGYPGYPAQKTSYIAPNNSYPAYNGYPAPNTGFSAQNTSYPAPNTGYPAYNGQPTSNTGYPAPNTGFSAQNTSYPAPNTGFSAYNGYPKPNTGFSAQNTSYPAPNTSYPAYNGTGYNNTSSLANCKCNLPRQESTVTKEQRSMDACIISCGGCPEGMKRVFGRCVSEDFEEY